MCYVKQANVGQEEMSGFVVNPFTVTMIVVIWILTNWGKLSMNKNFFHFSFKVR